MGELGVLVAVAVGGFVSAWVSKLIAGTLVTPLLYLDASCVPSMTHKRIGRPLCVGSPPVGQFRAVGRSGQMATTWTSSSSPAKSWPLRV